MKSLLIPAIALILLTGIAVAQRAYYIPRLPPQVAAHMGWSGDVDRWEDTADTVAGTARAWLTLTSIFLGITLVSVLAVRYLPDQFVNVPNKEYWLATRRRRGELTTIVLSFYLWLLAAFVATGVGLTQAIVQATFSGREQIGLPVLAALIIFLIAQIAWLFVRLSRRREPRHMHGRGDRRA